MFDFTNGALTGANRTIVVALRLGLVVPFLVGCYAFTKCAKQRATGRLEVRLTDVGCVFAVSRRCG